MEMVLYLIGNWCCILAAAILLKAYHGKRLSGGGEMGDVANGVSEPHRPDVPVVSRDMQVVLGGCRGTIVFLKQER